MTTLLKQLGDDWHNPHPYEPLIRTTLSSTPYLSEIEHCLIGLYVDEQSDFKLVKQPVKSSLYAVEIEILSSKKKKLLEEIKKESEAFEKLAKKFEETYGLAVPLEDDEEEEDAPTPKKTSNASPRTAKLNQQHKVMLTKSTKSTMATMQQSLIGMKTELDEIDARISCYTQYHEADIYYQQMLQSLVLSYEKEKNIITLVKGLQEMFPEYDRLKRIGIPIGSCSGKAGLCAVHHLPLHHAIYNSKGLAIGAKCSLAPPVYLM